MAETLSEKQSAALEHIKTMQTKGIIEDPNTANEQEKQISVKDVLTKHLRLAWWIFIGQWQRSDRVLMLKLMAR